MTTRTLVSAAPALDLIGGYYLQFEAVDPATGLAVAGVSVSKVVVYGSNIGAQATEEFQSLPPLLTYEGPG